MQTACKGWGYPAELYLRGFFSFAAPEEIERILQMSESSRFKSANLWFFWTRELTLRIFRPQEAKNVVSSMFRKSWEGFCYKKGLYGYPFSSQMGFHVTDNHVPIGRKVPWGVQGKGDPRCCKMSPGVGFGDMAFRHRPSSGPTHTSRSNPECYSRNLVPEQS